MDFNIFQIDPVAFSIGPLIVRWYALAYLAGFLLGWKYCIKLVSGKEGDRPNAQDIDDFLTWVVIGVIVGGRLGYVLFYNLPFYLSDPLEIVKVWNGGMSFHGGVIGVIFATLGFSKLHNIPLFKLSDIVCAAAPVGLFFGRIANFVNAELYGKVTTMPWGIAFPEDPLPRHPSQLYEAALEGVVLFIILNILTRDKSTKSGTVSGMFLVGYGLFRALIEFVREPDAQIGLIGGFISMGQLLCLPMILGGALLVYLSAQGKLSGTNKDAK